MLPARFGKPIVFVAGLLVGAVGSLSVLYVLRTDAPGPSVAGPTPSTSPFPASPTPSQATSESPSPAATAKLTIRDRLRMDGIGSIRVGMTVDQAERAAEIKLRVDTEFTEACRYAFPIGEPRDLAFMTSYGKIVRVDVSANSAIKTVSGIGVGNTEHDVLRVYGDRIKREPHPYLHETGSYLVYRPAGERTLLLIFETDGKKVVSFRSGVAEFVRATEGCA
jgi:hypothetical protein